jgi:hypothetical protein
LVDTSIKHIFVFNPSVGIKYFKVGRRKHVFAYSQCRSSMCMWNVHDLDLESTINLSTGVNKTWSNST